MSIQTHIEFVQNVIFDNSFDFITPDNVDIAIDVLEVMILSELPGRLPEAQWDILRRYILQRDEYKCGNCHRTNRQLDVHHIVPVKVNGTSRLTNLKTLCHDCHKKIHKWM